MAADRDDCPFEGVFRVELQSLHEDLKELKERVGRLEQTLARVDELGWRVELLEARRDVDTPDDLDWWRGSASS